MKITIYIEGGGDSKELHTRCREGFRKLLEKCGYTGRMPRLVVCGSRETAFKDFKSAYRSSTDNICTLMLIDSEDPMEDIESTWEHLRNRDRWEKPEGASDEQVLFMTTCMETWIVTDRQTISAHYGKKLQSSALPSLLNVENCHRHEIQKLLVRATRNCTNSYSKGRRSFEILGKLNPGVLKKHLPSFERNIEILNKKILG